MVMSCTLHCVMLGCGAIKRSYVMEVPGSHALQDGRGKMSAAQAGLAPAHILETPEVKQTNTGAYILYPREYLRVRYISSLSKILSALHVLNRYLNKQQGAQMGRRLGKDHAYDRIQMLLLHRDVLQDGWDRCQMLLCTPSW